MRISTLNVKNGKNLNVSFSEEKIFGVTDIKEFEGALEQIFSGNASKDSDLEAEIVLEEFDVSQWVISILKDRGEEISVLKDGQSSTESEALKFIGENLKLNINPKFLSQRILDLSDLTEEAQEEQILKKLNDLNESYPIEDEKIEPRDFQAERNSLLEKIRLAEEDVKRFTLQKDKVDNIYGKISSDEDKLQKYLSSIGKVEDLTKISSRVDSELKKFVPLSERNDLDAITKRVKASRIRHIIMVLKSFKNRMSFLSEAPKKNPNPKKAQSNLLLSVFLVAQTALWGIIGIATQSAALIAVGLVVTLFLLMLMIILKLHHTQSDVKAGRSRVNQPGNNPAQLRANEDRLLVNSAWISALKTEKERVRKNISARLGIDDYNNLAKEIKTLQVEIEKSLSSINQINSESMSYEEYEQKRRIIDLLTVELNFLEEEELDSNIEKLQRVSLPIFIYNLKKLSAENLGEIFLLIESIRSYNQVIVIE